MNWCWWGSERTTLQLLLKSRSLSTCRVIAESKEFSSLSINTLSLFSALQTFVCQVPVVLSCGRGTMIEWKECIWDVTDLDLKSTCYLCNPRHIVESQQTCKKGKITLLAPERDFWVCLPSCGTHQHQGPLAWRVLYWSWVHSRFILVVTILEFCVNVGTAILYFPFA